ncbi:MAG TPA: hypothetical protein VFP72_01350, partial [Kineosporiaceae bacterium]|nr:hypothetical protein [Kineosporiaceae bacterium]
MGQAEKTAPDGIPVMHPVEALPAARTPSNHPAAPAAPSADLVIDLRDGVLPTACPATAGSAAAEPAGTTTSNTEPAGAT